MNFPLEAGLSSRPPDPAPCPQSYGEIGSWCLVISNYLSVEFLGEDVLHEYDVSITPEKDIPASSSRGCYFAVLDQLSNCHLDKRLLAYDGRRQLYSSGTLGFEHKEFTIWRGGMMFIVSIKFVALSVPKNLVEMFIQGRFSIGSAFRGSFIKRHGYTPICGALFSQNVQNRQSLQSRPLSCWRGFTHSFRPTQMGLSLNIDMTSRVVFEAIPVVDFVKQHLSRHDLSRNFTEFERNEIMTALRGIKVEVTHCRNQRQKYRIFGLTENATADLTFYDNTGSKRHVVEYFRQTYQCDLKYTHLPCLSVGHKGKKFMPIELCKIVEGQPYSGERDQKLRNEIHRIASVLPSVRHDDICQAVVGNRYGDDPYALEFGISICETLARVEVRILPTPELSIRGYKFIPERGRWKLKQMKLLQKGVDRGNKINWSFINFSSEVSVDGADSFFGNLVYCSRVLGMAFSNEATVSDNYGYSGGYEAEAVKTSLKCLYDKAKTKLKGRKLDILIVILPDNNRSIYGDLKRICETDLGIMTQCILSKNVLNPNFEILDFLLLKLNVKAGRTNIVLVAAELKSLPLVGDGPTIIFGADVNHPGPGDDRNPSIAAVVASRDWPNMSKYVARVSAQLPGHELIENLCSMIREHLESFKKANGLPNRIIYYRDGVSETQFDDLLNIEGEAIRQACDLVASNYKPKITFVVVQKRHHVRLFPFDFNDSEVVKNHGNILPGTVVDSRICRQTGTDFFLCSHSSTEGTSRPTHYNVLLDENNFDRVQLQWLTNDLCYTFARCMSSTSVVPPVLYADSAAYRATFHLEPKTESVALRTLLPLTESLREEMYYI